MTALHLPPGQGSRGTAPVASPRMLDPKVFKAYDVRGIYPDELDEAGARAIGRAYVEEFEPRRIAVGRDMRLSAPPIAGAAMRGATEAGGDGPPPRGGGGREGYFPRRRARPR